jgi:hypothetical protein
MAELSDDCCIGMALLHGGEFYVGGDDRWWVNSNWPVGDNLHPIEVERTHKKGRASFDSLAEISRAYCKYHNLLR